jgi:hypothetical protein
MKGLFLTGAILLAPWNSQTISDIQDSNVSLLSHRTAQHIPFQIFQRQWGEEVNQIIFGTEKRSIINPSLINRGIFKIRDIRSQKLKRYRIHNLPKTSQNKTTTISNNVTLVAGDNGVSSSVVNIVENTIQNISLPILKQTIGEPKGIRIILLSNQTSYRNLLLQSGVPTNQINEIVSGTEGLSVGNDIIIPVYSLHDQSDLANSITHELTHSVINNLGISDTVPVWVNEGYSWYNGMLAKAKVSPSLAQQEESLLNAQIKQAENKGMLLPLSASEDDILRASYTIEWVDYLAVKNLIDQNGLDTFKAFITGIASQGVNTSFQEQYHTDISTYEKEFEQSLGI